MLRSDDFNKRYLVFTPCQLDRLDFKVSLSLRCSYFLFFFVFDEASMLRGSKFTVRRSSLACQGMVGAKQSPEMQRRGKELLIYTSRHINNKLVSIESHYPRYSNHVGHHVPMFVNTIAYTFVRELKAHVARARQCSGSAASL